MQFIFVFNAMSFIRIYAGYDKTKICVFILAGT